MNQEKIGAFITKQRKKKKLTQEELAEILGVSNRTISRWENGKNMPDVSLFKPLCEELNISVNELLNGEKINENNYIKVTDENLINYSKYLKNKTYKKILIILITIIIFLTTIILISNKTFLKTKYISDFNNNIEINIPRFTYYRGTNGIKEHYLKLKTLKQPDEVNIHINAYLNTLEKFTCKNEIYYYNGDKDFTILNYYINNDGISFLNTIYIRYSNGKYCNS